MKLNLILGTLVVGILVLLASCSQATSNGTPLSIATARADLRPLSAEFSTRNAVSYSGFKADHVTAPNSTEILADLNLLVQTNLKLIRLFDSSDNFSKVVLQVIHNNSLDIKVQLGVWISGPESSNHAANLAEINRAIALATDSNYKDIILAVSVGNETMIDWSGLQVPVADMAAYIKQVRDAVTQPVTTDDNYVFFEGKTSSGGTANPVPIFNVVDFVSLHTYPFSEAPYSTWDWQQLSVAAGNARAQAMIDKAIVYAKKNVADIQAKLDASGIKLPLTIGETGWKSAQTGASSEQFMAHPVNQKMYFDALNTWATTAKADGSLKAIFYFEAFDEPWKGSDDGWGLFNVDRKAKYVAYTTLGSNATQDVPGSLNPVYYTPAASSGAVTANTYSLYQETVPGGAATPSGNLTPLVQWIAWDNPWTAGGVEKTAGSGDSADEGTKYMRITPVPKSWGWGFFLYLQNHENLSNFESAGHLNLSVRTAYPGKIELGFYTLNTQNSNGCDVYIQVDPTNNTFGYSNDGNWHQVSIPISTLKAAANPSGNFDLTLVAHGLTIADRYANTGKASNSNITTPIDVDNIYWSK